MKRSTGGATYAAGTHRAWTVPAGHKYELLELAVWGDPSGAIVYALVGTFGGVVIIVDEQDATPVGRYSWRSSWDALCFNTGDTLDVAAAAGAGSWSYVVSYIDVDEA